MSRVLPAQAVLPPPKQTAYAERSFSGSSRSSASSVSSAMASSASSAVSSTPTSTASVMLPPLTSPKDVKPAVMPSRVPSQIPPPQTAPQTAPRPAAAAPHSSQQASPQQPPQQGFQPYHLQPQPQPQQPQGYNNSGLPPLFKLVLDSTLPMMNQQQQQQQQVAAPQPAQPQAAPQAAPQMSMMPVQAMQMGQPNPSDMRGAPASQQVQQQYHYPMAVPTAMYFPPFQQLPTPPQQMQGQMQGQQGQMQGQVPQQMQQVPQQIPQQIQQVPQPYPYAYHVTSAHMGLPAAPSPLASPLPAVGGLKRRRAGSSGPRKKRECPICHNFYSNLTTHKSIHNKGSKPYSCTTCSRAFKRLNDLIRHEKCHLSKLGAWEYQCPFHPGPNSGNGRGELCHQTGYFTRCDTYKNHLKAIHFKYPPNTLKSERSKVSGHCKECGMFFNGVQDWLKNHIENNGCPKIMNYNNSRKKR